MKLGKKTIALLGVPLGLGVAAAVVFLVVLPKGSAPVGVPDPGPGQHGLMLPLEAKVVNLAAGGDFHYAKVGVTIELRPADAGFYALVAEARTTAETVAVKEYEGATPLLQDAIGRITSAKTSTQLGTPAGREALRSELLAAFREILGDAEPAAVTGAAPQPSAVTSAAPASSPGTSAAPPSAAPASSVAPSSPTKVLDIYFTDLVMQ
jgi:flagellar basal body-associated protein FliL